MNFMTKDIAIDLGTAMTKVYIKDKGIVLNEPTIVAINNTTDEILAIGSEAKEMIGRTPENIVAVKPIRSGAISDFHATELLLQKILSSVVGKNIFVKTRLLISVPASITDVEKRAIEETAYLAGAKEVYIMDTGLAAAIGSGLKVENPEGCMVVNIGGGVTEAAVISLGGIVVSNSIKLAGDDIDKDIIEYIKDKYDILIGENVAEEIKNTIGTAVNSISEERMQIKGRNLLTGLPDTITISTSDVEQAMTRALEELIKLINITLEKTPPELSGDIIKNGIVICGGGAYIKNIDRFITNRTGLTVAIADKPLDTVIKGLGKCLNNIHTLKLVGKRR